MNTATPSDLLICVLILALAFGSLAVTRLSRGVVMFIVFGLVLALSWTRLQAPDLALTEAALGAGVLGAMFLASLRGQKEYEAGEKVKELEFYRVAMVSSFLLGTLLLVVWLAGVFHAWSIPGDGLAGPAHEFLAITGVSNPVTAVILNYRVYDTFLEIGVLFLVMLCVFALQPEKLTFTPTPRPEDPMLRAYVRGIAPLMVLAAGYLLWAGAFRPGGAFQAGAMLGGAGILLHLSRSSRIFDMRGMAARLLLAAGFFGFCVLGILVMLAGLDFLQWPPHLAKYTILAAETASTLSIGITLTGLYAAVDGRIFTPAAVRSEESNLS